MLDRERLGERTAEAETDQRGLLNFLCVEEGFQIFNQERHAVIPARCLAAAVAAQVVAQDPEIARERRDLAVP